MVFPERAKLLSFDVELVADMTVINPFDFFLDESAETFPFKYDKILKHDLAPYLAVSEKGPELLAFLKRIDMSKVPTINFLTQVSFACVFKGGKVQVVSGNKNVLSEAEEGKTGDEDEHKKGGRVKKKRATGGKVLGLMTGGGST